VLTAENKQIKHGVMGHVIYYMHLCCGCGMYESNKLEVPCYIGAHNHCRTMSTSVSFFAIFWFLHYLGFRELQESALHIQIYLSF